MFRKILLVVLFAISPTLSAGIYKWVDENGVTHYGDKPTDQAEPVTVDTGLSGASFGGADGEAAIDCAAARMLESRLESGQIDGLTFTDFDGTRRPMTEADVAIAERIVAGVIKRDC